MRYLLMTAIIVAGIVAFSWIYFDKDNQSPGLTDKRGSSRGPQQQIAESSKVSPDSGRKLEE